VRPLSVDTVRELVNVMGAAYREALVFPAASGLRPSELFGLTWDRLDLGAGLVTVDRQLVKCGRDGVPVLGPLKTDASYRAVKIGSASILMLKGRGVRPADALVFQGRLGACYRVTPGRCRGRRRGRPCLASGAGGISLRHHHASLLVAAGLSPVAVAHRLGHKDATETLQTYGDLRPDDDRMAAASDGLLVLPDSGTP
jgi:integrase